MKEKLADLVMDKTANESSKSTTGLLLAVLLKYGIAPLVCVYLAWALIAKDEQVQKNSDTIVNIVREQTAATVQHTEVQRGLITVISANTSKLDELEKQRREDERRRDHR